MTSLVPSSEVGVLQMVIDLEAAGALTPVSLDLQDPSMPLHQWMSLGRMLGQVNRSVNWWLGDWLNFGEDVYGEDHAQGVDDIQSRYDEAERVTGLDHGTLLNISSVCRKVAKKRRRVELGFWIHAEVAPLEPAEQERYLQEAIDGSWNRSDLRRAIRGTGPEGSLAGEPGGGGMVRSEQIETAARTVLKQGRRTPDGDVLVPAEAWAQLSAAFGGE